MKNKIITWPTQTLRTVKTLRLDSLHWKPPFGSRVLEWIHLKTTHLRFRVYSQSVFSKIMMSSGSCACSKSSSLFLVYLCGNITAPHTDLACIHRIESVSLVSRVRRYFLSKRCVNEIKKKKGRRGKALALCGCGLSVYRKRLFSKRFTQI